MFYWAYAISLAAVVALTTAKTLGGFSDLQLMHRVMRPFYNDHTAYGCVIALMLPLAVYYVFEPGTKLWKRLFAGALAALLLVGLGLSYCRAAWISVVLALGMYILVRLGVRLRWMVLAAAVLVGLFFTFRSEIVYRMGKNTQDSSFTIAEQVQSISNITTDASNLERLNRWDAAFRMWREYPLTGIGPGAYQFIYGPYQKSEMLTEQGVPGALLVLAIFITTFLTGERVYRTAKDRRLGHLALVLAVSLLTYYIHGALNNFLDTDKLSVPFWGLTAAVVALDIVTEKAPEKR